MFREIPQTVKNAQLFPVVSHPLSSSFTTQLFKNDRREKGQVSSGLHEFVSLVPRRRRPSHSLSAVDFLMGGVSAVCILFHLSVRPHPHYPLCRPSLRRQPHPLSGLSCWCKTRMRWCVAHTVFSIQLTWLLDQTRSSCHSVQGCRRRILSHLQGRGSRLAMAWKHRERDPLFPYAGFELCLQYAHSLSALFSI